MKVIYPIIITRDEAEATDTYLVKIPDLDGLTQGNSIADSIDMARDYIGLTIMDREDDHEDIPESNTVLPKTDKGIATLVDVDIDVYRRKHDNKVVKKTLTIPNYLNELGKEQNINFSELLTNALKQKVKV